MSILSNNRKINATNSSFASHHRLIFFLLGCRCFGSLEILRSELLLKVSGGVFQYLKLNVYEPLLIGTYVGVLKINDKNNRCKSWNIIIKMCRCHVMLISVWCKLRYLQFCQSGTRRIHRWILEKFSTREFSNQCSHK